MDWKMLSNLKGAVRSHEMSELGIACMMKEHTCLPVGGRATPTYDVLLQTHRQENKSDDKVGVEMGCMQCDEIESNLTSPSESRVCICVKGTGAAARESHIIGEKALSG